MTELFNIQHPVMCGGMMWLAKPGLCSAISNAGGLGNLTAGNYESADDFREAVRETRRMTDRPFCVNITLLPSVRITRELHVEYFDVCCEEGVAALEISGAPVDRYLGAEYVERAKRSGVKLIHKLGAVRHAKHAESAGYDAVIAAGIEEGGPNTFVETFVRACLPEVQAADRAVESLRSLASSGAMAKAAHVVARPGCFLIDIVAPRWYAGRRMLI